MRADGRVEGAESVKREAVRLDLTRDAIGTYAVPSRQAKPRRGPHQPRGRGEETLRISGNEHSPT